MRGLSIMPLFVPPAPEPARRSVLAALSARPADTRATLRPEMALPVHEIARVSRQDPPRTRLTAWRFLLGPAGQEAEGAAVVGAAEAMYGTEGWSFAHFRGGPYVTSTVRALSQGEALPPPYQPRLLSVPELYMLTLWLHGDPGADPAEGTPDAADLLIPLAPAPPGIAAHRPHRVDTLLPLLTHRLSASPLLSAPA